MDPYATADTISQALTTFFWIGLLVGAMICGTIGAILADFKGETPWKWYVVCAILGLLGISLLACKPRRPLPPTVPTAD